ncbi:MAG TPA: glycosyltransferase family 4 protein [Acidobacteriaceae bacterium]|nr:glycosyltransferase family 4 protein [Acidobacteriaceae bacterium]
MSETQPLKVLVSAFWFSPVQGSECAVGWDYVRAIAARHKVWVITRTVEREETELYLRQHPELLPNVTLHYIPMKDRTFYFPLREVVYALIYKGWQKQALAYARRLDAEIDFDLIHQLNGIGFREPGYLWKIGKPFVWGPVGGLQYFPLRLMNAVPPARRPFFVFKNLTTILAIYMGSRSRRAAQAAAAIFAASTNVAEKIRTAWGRNASVLAEVSAPELEPRLPTRRNPGEPLQIVWCGSCELRKALNIVLLALGRLRNSEIRWRLTAVGGGPLLEEWKALAGSEGILQHCDFLGKMPRKDVQAVMASGHCFVQPSLYDATTTVVAEALAHGLPVICLDHFGFRDAVLEECGIRIRPGSLDQVVDDFAEAIESLALDEDRRCRMGAAAQAAATRLTLHEKERVVDEIYQKALAYKGGGTAGAGIR